MRRGIVRPFPECGRKPWLEREFSAGQGERTSLGPGGDQVVKFWEKVTGRRVLNRRRVRERDILSRGFSNSIWYRR